MEWLIVVGAQNPAKATNTKNTARKELEIAIVSKTVSKN